jgi:hypothetical protein
MSLNESIVEDAALEWFRLCSAPLNYGGQVGELGYEVSVKGCGWLRTIWRMNPAISEESLHTSMV